MRQCVPVLGLQLPRCRFRGPYKGTIDVSDALVSTLFRRSGIDDGPYLTLRMALGCMVLVPRLQSSGNIHGLRRNWRACPTMYTAKEGLKS